jgi:hypothetical protein
MATAIMQLGNATTASAAGVLMSFATTASPWYVTTFQLVTHLPLISDIAIAVLHRNKTWEMGIVAILYTLTLFFSTTYHTCQAAGACLFGWQEYIWQQCDNIFAFGASIPILILLSSATPKHNSLIVSTAFWTQVAFLSVLGVVVMTVLSSITGPGMGVPPEKALIVILYAICILFFKILYADQGRMYIYEHYDASISIGGLALVVVGVVFFVIELSGYEWVFHGIWHLCVFTGSGMVMIGTVAQLPEPVTKPNAIDLEIALMRDTTMLSSPPVLMYTNEFE